VPQVAAAEPDAAAAAADARLEVPGAAAGPDAVAEVPGAAAEAVVKPGVGVQRVGPAAQALWALLRVSLAEKRPLVFAPIQAFSGHPRLRHRTPAPPATRPGSSQICCQGQASRSGWSRPEPVPSLSAFSAYRLLRYRTPDLPATLLSSSGSSPICCQG